MKGDAGKDIFRFVDISDLGVGSGSRDVLLDFSHPGSKHGDGIDLSGIDANELVNGNQAFTFIGTAAFTGPGQVRVYDDGTHTIVQLNVDGDLQPEGEIQINDGGAKAAAYHASDFIL